MYLLCFEWVSSQHLQKGRQEKQLNNKDLLSKCADLRFCLPWIAITYHGSMILPQGESVRKVVVLFAQINVHEA